MFNPNKANEVENLQKSNEDITLKTNLDSQDSISTSNAVKNNDEIPDGPDFSVLLSKIVYFSLGGYTAYLVIDSIRLLWVASQSAPIQ